MRVLFITRTHPHKNQGSVELRLHDRLSELSELGHEVLVLTKWTGDAVDFELPQRIEIRSPFKTFRPWEWTRALPMVFAWRPDLLHVFDPGLSTLERTLSVELMAMTMMETLKRVSRGRSPFLGSLVSLGAVRSVEQARDGWTKAGVKFVEHDWLNSSGGTHTAPVQREIGSERRLQIGLAGQVARERPLRHVIDALDFMRTTDDFEMSVYLDRASLTKSDRTSLGHAERMEAFGAAVGARLRVLRPESRGTSKIEFDATILAGLELSTARKWVELFNGPMVFSEAQLPLVHDMRRLGHGPKVLGQEAPTWVVSEIAPVSQALAVALDRRLLAKAWLKIEQGALTVGRDIAANHVSRIYSQIAGSGSNPYA